MLLLRHQEARCGLECLVFGCVGSRNLSSRVVSAVQQMLLLGHWEARCGRGCLGVWAAGI